MAGISRTEDGKTPRPGTIEGNEGEKGQVSGSKREATRGIGGGFSQVKARKRRGWARRN